MRPALEWFGLSTVAFVLATVALLISAFVLTGILARILPLLSDTRREISELGEMASETVTHAASTMDIIETRVTETMGNAAAASKGSTRQVIGVGAALAGTVLITRFLKLLRGKKEGKGRRGRRG